MFANWRYTDVPKRIEDPAFILNQEPYRQAQILLAGGNFGCGSSREHAVWAMREWGFRAVIASSFGAIYHGNCVRNGILPVVLPDASVQTIADWVARDPRANRVTIDLPAETVTAAGAAYGFKIGDADKLMLLEGLDPIGVTLKREAEIAAFEQRDRARRPWVHAIGPS
jgi:3-isopropylmalate/(R)-2-methylmalate dehydratase small subunit